MTESEATFEWLFGEDLWGNDIVIEDQKTRKGSHMNNIKVRRKSIQADERREICASREE